MTKKFNPEHAKKHGYTRADWDDVDASELTDDVLANPTTLEQASPVLAKKFKDEIKKRGRPPLESPKVAVSIRLDSDLVARMKAEGRGWQSRANEMLREAMGL